MMCDVILLPTALSKASILATIPSSWKTSMCYYHSFGMSENYLVFIEQPLIINSMKLVTSQVKGKCMRDCMLWRPEELVRVPGAFAKIQFRISPESCLEMYSIKYIKL
jgi:hypothetical protein